MAGYGRRIIALLIDWFLASGVAMLVFPGVAAAPLLIFAGMQLLMLGLLGTTIGKRVVRIQVVRVGGAPMGLVKALIRTVLLMLIVPLVLVDSDGRGLHDRVAKTVEIVM